MKVQADEEIWEIISATEDELFPSLIYATATMKADPDAEEQEDVLGDLNGTVGVAIDSPKKSSSLKIEISGGEFIKPTTYKITLPKADMTYYVYPLLKYDYQALLKIRQPTPEDITMKVTLNGEDLGEKNRRFTVRSVNDCPFIALDEKEQPYSTAWMFAAYVNENHPEVDRILGKALKAELVSSFAGYQGSSDDVLAEVEAIWDTLQEAGFRYSNITRASIESDQVASQHVRLIGDALETSQANCVEGSVIFASILRKLDMNPFLVLVPGHMFVGLYLDEEANEFSCIETTMLGSHTFEEAVDAGNAQYAKYEDQFEEVDQLQCEIVDIDEARKSGILPIRETSKEK